MAFSLLCPSLTARSMAVASCPKTRRRVQVPSGSRTITLELVHLFVHQLLGLRRLSPKRPIATDNPENKEREAGSERDDEVDGEVPISFNGFTIEYGQKSRHRVRKQPNREESEQNDHTTTTATVPMW